jgi:hypothetical protein
MSDFRELLNQEIAALAAKIEQGELPDEMRYQLKKEVVALERSVELGNYDENMKKFLIILIGACAFLLVNILLIL